MNSATYPDYVKFAKSALRSTLIRVGPHTYRNYPITGGPFYNIEVKSEGTRLLVNEPTSGLSHLDNLELVAATPSVFWRNREMCRTALPMPWIDDERMSRIVCEVRKRMYPGRTPWENLSDESRAEWIAQFRCYDEIKPYI